MVLYGKTRTEVRKKLKAATDRGLEAGAPVKDATATVSAWITEWESKGLEASNRKAGTKALCKCIAKNHLKPEPFGAISLDRLRPSDVDALILRLRRKTHHEQEPLGRHRSEGIPRLAGHPRRCRARRSARRRIRRRRSIRLLPPARRPDTSRRLRSRLCCGAAEGTRYHAALSLIAATGLRRGEALGLKWGDVDFEAGTMRVRSTLSRIDGELVVTEPKTENSRRTLPLSPAVASLLKSHRKAQRLERIRAGSASIDSGHVITTESGRPVRAAKPLSLACRGCGQGWARECRTAYPSALGGNGLAGSRD